MRLHVCKENAGLVGVHYSRHEHWLADVRCSRSQRHPIGSHCLLQHAAIRSRKICVRASAGIYCGGISPIERKIPERRCACRGILSGAAAGIARVTWGCGATCVIVVMIAVIALVKNAAVIM